MGYVPPIAPDQRLLTQRYRPSFFYGVKRVEAPVYKNIKNRYDTLPINHLYRSKKASEKDFGRGLTFDVYA